MGYFSNNDQLAFLKKFFGGLWQPQAMHVLIGRKSYENWNYKQNQEFGIQLLKLNLASS